MEPSKDQEVLASILCGKSRDSAEHIADLQTPSDSLRTTRLSSPVVQDYLRCAFAGNAPTFREALRDLAKPLLKEPTGGGAFTPRGANYLSALCGESMQLAADFSSAPNARGFSREQWEITTERERTEFHRHHPSSALGYLGDDVSNGGGAQFKHYVAGRAICCTSFSTYEGQERGRELMDALDKGPARLWNGLKLAHVTESLRGRTHFGHPPGGAAPTLGKVESCQLVREAVGGNLWKTAATIFEAAFTDFTTTQTPPKLPKPASREIGDFNRHLKF